MADPKVVEQPPDQLQVLFSDLFKWIPRWRDKLVIEVWSYSTFVRLGWSEEHEAAEAAKFKETSEKEWQAKQEEIHKSLDQERHEKHAAARKHAVHVAEVSRQRAQAVVEEEKKQIHKTIEVMSGEASKQECALSSPPPPLSRALTPHHGSTTLPSIPLSSPRLHSYPLFSPRSS